MLHRTRNQLAVGKDLTTPQPEEGPVPLAEAIAEVLWRCGLRNKEARHRLEAAWQRVIGNDLANRVRLGAWRRGLLEVWTADAALLHRLAQFEAPRLLQRLQAELGPGAVLQLRFRLG